MDENTQSNDSYSSDNENQKGGIKWATLEHRGVTFPQAYVPHGAKLLFKGEPIEIKPEVEEICNQWVQAQVTEFAEKETVVKNFTENFLKLFDPSLGATSLD